MNSLATLPESPEALTMSSREIAEVTGKLHTHVLADIRNMLSQLGIGETSFRSSYLSAQNKALPEYRLPYRETMILVTGYSVTLRAKVIDRWAELEDLGIAGHKFAPSYKDSPAPVSINLPY